MEVEGAIIGGTGVYDPRMLGDVKNAEVETPFGKALLQVGEYRSRKIAFVARHGCKHTLPPHAVNYRANIAALNILRARWAISTAAVGSLHREITPGSIGLATQFIDFTKSRKNTFYDGEDRGVYHIDYTEPYCPALRQVLKRAAARKGLELFEKGTYVCTEGPRYETPAEIRMFAALGADFVGMTNVPEVVLAREAGICYAAVVLVTNYAAGISSHFLTHEEVLEVMKQKIGLLRELLTEALDLLPERSDCSCVPPGKELKFEGKVTFLE